MNYSEIKTIDIANGPGARTSLFVSGCRRHCRNCFNPDTWSFTSGKPYTEETTEYILETLEPDYVHGLTLLGGEPMEPENQQQVAKLLHDLRERFGNKKNVWLFSGFTIEELIDKDNPVRTEYTSDILSMIDIMVDGPYDETLHNVALRFRGSANQRIIDMNASRESHQVVLWEDDPIFSAHEKEQKAKMSNMKKSSGKTEDESDAQNPDENQETIGIEIQ